MQKFKIIIYTCLILLLHNDIIAQDKQDQQQIPLSLRNFLSNVSKGNLEFISNQFNVSISEAELKAAKVFPDPEISVGYSNNEDRTLQMGQSVEAGISYPINFGNKRGAGIALAKSNHELSQMVLNAYFQNLRADAALSYFATLRDYRAFQLQQNIYEQLSKLAYADSIRLINGETARLDALQSSLEARSQLTKVFQSKADMQNASVNLMRLQGKNNFDTLDKPSDDFPYKKYNFILQELLLNALENRSDILAAIKNREVSEKNLSLLKANRAFEINLEAGYSYNSIVKNEIAPAPAYNGLSAGITIPFKFSSLNKGSVEAANLVIKQSQTLLTDTEIQIQAEVIRAYNNFIAQDKKVEHYNLGLVEDAGKILQGRIYSYQQGESGLLDVLNAQRTYIELQLNHLEALFEYTSALIDLERAAGIWDINF